MFRHRHGTCPVPFGEGTLRHAPPVQVVNVEDDSDDDANNDSTNDNNDKIPRDLDDDGRAEPPTRI